MSGGFNKRILVVEDDETVLSLTKQILEDEGYRVVTASNPHEALWLLTECKGAVDLLLTDVIMPGVSGRRLADAVQERFSHVKVLCMSGYGSIIACQEALENDSFLPKPFARAALTAKVRKILSGGASAACP